MSQIPSPMSVLYAAAEDLVSERQVDIYGSDGMRIQLSGDIGYSEWSCEIKTIPFPVSVLDVAVG